MTGDYYALLRVDSAAISCYTYPVCYYPPERSRITLNKSEFISAIGNRTLKRDADIKPIIDAALTIIAEQMKAGESITLSGFGTFEVRERAATTARNPRTGEEVAVPEKKVPAFRAAKALKDAVK